MIYTIIASDMLIRPPVKAHRGGRLNIVNESTFQLRKLAERVSDAAVFGFVLGSEDDFGTWRAANPDKATVVADVEAEFTGSWREEWLLIGDHVGIDYSSADLTTPITYFEALLAAMKTKIMMGIDQKTRVLIGLGFEYPAASDQMFSLSQEAQRKWTALYVAKSLLTYPVVAVTANEQTNVSLEDANDVEAFFTAMVTAVRGHIDSGRVLKNTVRDTDVTTEDGTLALAEDTR